jgi:hypothetical protein
MPGAGRKELRSLRLRAENTPGNAVAPRYVWRGPVDGIDDQREVAQKEEQIGIFGGSDNTYIPKLMAELPIPETEATFEQIADLFQMCGFGTSGGGNRAGSAYGASGSAVVFTLPIPSSSGPLTYSYTAEVGDDAYAERMEYALCKELTLTFTGGEGMRVEATLFGRQGTPANAEGTFSNVGTLVTVETILSSRGTFYLSPVGSGWGTGQVTAGNILAGQLTFTPKWEAKFPVDSGQIYFHTAVFTDVEIEGELTLEHQISGTYGAAGSAGQIQKWRDELSQLLQMTWRGGTINLGSSGYVNKELTVQLPVRWRKFEPLDDQEGNDIRVGKFVSKYNESTPTAGRGTIIVVRVGTSEFSGAN